MVWLCFLQTQCRTVWLSTVKRLLICLFISTVYTIVTDGRTDRRAALMHSIARQKSLVRRCRVVKLIMESVSWREVLADGH